MRTIYIKLQGGKVVVTSNHPPNALPFVAAAGLHPDTAVFQYSDPFHKRKVRFAFSHESFPNLFEKFLLGWHEPLDWSFSQTNKGRIITLRMDVPDDAQLEAVG